MKNDNKWCPVNSDGLWLAFSQCFFSFTRVEKITLNAIPTMSLIANCRSCGADFSEVDSYNDISMSIVIVPGVDRP